MNVLLLMRHTLHYWPPVILLAVIFIIILSSSAMQVYGSTPSTSVDFYANRHNCRGTFEKVIQQRGSR